MTAIIPLSSAAHRRSLLIWTLSCALTGVVFIVYLRGAITAGQGEVVMPLDDAYIHFQYAHQIASGQPYVYNPGLPPTSGATSFLYPYLLALGDVLGFRGLNLGIWAMAIGALALAASGLVVYRLSRLYAPIPLSILMIVLFIVSGPVSWHYMSGMETGLVTLFLLLVLYGFMTRQIMVCVVGASLLALTRPEGGALSVIAMAALYVKLVRADRAARITQTLTDDRRDWLWLFVPLGAVAVQPLVNLLVTGSAVASGNQSKSLFGMIPAYHDAIVGRVLSNFARMWVEFATGYSLREGWYIPFVVSMLALVGVLFLVRRRGSRLTGVLIIAWLLAGTAAVSTLDTAFWHFKRYHLPLMALFFPLAAWGVAAFPRRPAALRVGLLVLAAASALMTAVPFYNAYTLNAGYIARQPLHMARWLAANTPESAVVAVHDTGLIRYLGGRTTLDIVGLTTLGAAESWRNGPGAVAEFLDSLRPDYIASYGRGHGLGLGYLADTALYANELAAYPVTLDPNQNVALAADSQGIYAPDWTHADRARTLTQPALLDYLDAAQPAPLDMIDVADLMSERAHRYAWRDDERLGGFPTDVYDMPYVGCSLDACRIMDGGRHINGEESFDVHLSLTPDMPDMILVTRLHPVNAGTFDVYANDTLVSTRLIPALPGAWLDVATLIPRPLLTETTRIRIVPHTPGGHYMPYTHWLLAARPPALPDDAPFAAFQDGAIRLYAPELTTDDGQLAARLTWGTDGSAAGDYKLFIHVLDANGATIAQSDSRPGGGALPPGNWLPGTFTETIMVDLAQAPAGTAQVVMGLYDPTTNARLAPTDGDDAGRLLLGEVEITGDG